MQYYKCLKVGLNFEPPVIGYKGNLFWSATVIIITGIILHIFNFECVANVFSLFSFIYR